MAIGETRVAQLDGRIKEPPTDDPKYGYKDAENV